MWIVSTGKALENSSSYKERESIKEKESETERVLAQRWDVFSSGRWSSFAAAIYANEKVPILPLLGIDPLIFVIALLQLKIMKQIKINSSARFSERVIYSKKIYISLKLQNTN